MGCTCTKGIACKRAPLNKHADNLKQNTKTTIQHSKKLQAQKQNPKKSI